MSDDQPLGDLLVRCLLPHPRTRWPDERLDLASRVMLDVGLTAVEALDMLNTCGVGSPVRTALAVRGAFKLTRSEFEELLTLCRYTSDDISQLIDDEPHP